MKYPLQNVLDKLLSKRSDLENILVTSNWYEIDLFKNILRFKNPKQTFHPKDELIADLLWQDNRPFVDTVNRSKFQGLIANGYSSCQITKNGWKLKPNIENESEQVVLCMVVDSMYAFPLNEKKDCDLNDINNLKSWVEFCHKRSRAYAEKHNLSVDDNGGLTIRFEGDDKKELLLSDLSFVEEQEKNTRSKLSKGNSQPAIFKSEATGRAKVELINGRNWIKITEPGEIRFYTATDKRDSLCFTFDLESKDGESRFCTSPSKELEQKIIQLIFSLLETVSVTPSNRLKGYLQNKGFD